MYLSFCTHSTDVSLPWYCWTCTKCCHLAEPQMVKKSAVAVGEVALIQFMHRHGLLCCIQVYPVGQWFEPCIWDDYQCHQQVQAAQQLPPSLVGHHINSGAWLKDLKTYNRKLFWRWLAAAATVITACFCCAALVLRWRQHCNHCPSA